MMFQTFQVGTLLFSEDGDEAFINECMAELEVPMRGLKELLKVGSVVKPHYTWKLARCFPMLLTSYHLALCHRRPCITAESIRSKHRTRQPSEMGRYDFMRSLAAGGVSSAGPRT